jgi:pyridoxamine 5'-phosphate oxidase
MTTTDPLPPWRALLRGAREREGRAPQARWLQLASVAADSTPRVRTLVFRGWAGPAALDLLTDARSAKPAELALQAAVELCWLIPKARSQFRLRGKLQALPTELEIQERERHWQALTPGGPAVWSWPSPGEPLDSEAPFPSESPDGVPVPEHFQLLRIALTPGGAAGAHGPPPSPSPLAAGDAVEGGAAQSVSHNGNQRFGPKVLVRCRFVFDLQGLSDPGEAGESSLVFLHAPPCAATGSSRLTRPAHRPDRFLGCVRRGV